MSLPESVLRELVGKDVVLDAVSPFIYAGTLIGSDERYLILENADVHDLRDSSTTRELYVLETRMHGVRSNRKRVMVDFSQIASISALSDVVE